MHGLTRGEMLQMYYKDRRGVCVRYQEKDLRCDITQGYLRKEGAGQVMKGVCCTGGRWALARGGGAGVGWGAGRRAGGRQ